VAGVSSLLCQRHIASDNAHFLLAPWPARLLRAFLFLATDDEELLADLAIVLLWREGIIEPLTPPACPAHIYAQQVMALVLQESGITRPEIDAWLDDASDAVPKNDRDVVIRHMLAMGILTEDAGIIGLGKRAELEFGRRHFNELIAAFSSPWLLTVNCGAIELGSVHPANLGRRSGETSPILLLGGRNWKVADVDWPRRRVSVVPAESGGKARWYGMARMLPFSICRAEERIITGTNPPSKVSRRASERLGVLRNDLQFIDGLSLPLTADGTNRITVWLFAGGLVSASIAHELDCAGLPVIHWSDISVVVRADDLERVGLALMHVNITTAHPALPADLSTAMKFGLCLPRQLAEAVARARTSRSEEIAQPLLRSQRRIRCGLKRS